MKKALIQNSFKKIGRRHYTILGAIILLITVIHFVLQMSFIQNESLRVVDSLSKNVKTGEQTAKPAVEMPDAEEFEPKKISESNAPKKVEPAVRRESENTPPPARISPKKKVVRESRAERLRRAEKLLTGF